MLTNAMLFFIQTLFNLYIYVVVLRLLLQAIRVRFDNPLAQFAIKFTQPVVGPLQRVFPEFKGLDIAILIFAFGLEIIKFFLLLLLETTSLPNIGGIALLSLADLLRHLSNFYFYAIIFRAILSLVALMRYNPIVFTINQLTEPLLQPIRRVVPLVGGFDLSPIIVLVLLQLFEMLVVGSLIQAGMGLI